jgi:hypothetical protein
MTVYGIEALRIDKTVTPLNEPKDYSIRSQYNTPKIFMKGYGSVIVNGGDSWTNTIPVVHNLGYLPIFMVFFRHGGENVWQHSGWIDAASQHGVFMGKVHVSVNEIDIRIYATKTVGWNPWDGGDISVEYNYKLYVDPDQEAWG